MIAFIHPPKRNAFVFPNLWKAPTGLFLVIRPKAVSETRRVYPNVTTNTRYTNRKIPPPYFAARYGNLHILPSPTADPAIARTYPIRPEKDPLVCGVFAVLFFSIVSPPFLGIEVITVFAFTQWALQRHCRKFRLASMRKRENVKSQKFWFFTESLWIG